MAKNNKGFSIDVEANILLNEGEAQKKIKELQSKITSLQIEMNASDKSRKEIAKINKELEKSNKELLNLVQKASQDAMKNVEKNIEQTAKKINSNKSNKIEFFDEKYTKQQLDAINKQIEKTMDSLRLVKERRTQKAYDKFGSIYSSSVDSNFTKATGIGALSNVLQEFAPSSIDVKEIIKNSVYELKDEFSKINISGDIVEDVKTSMDKVEEIVKDSVNKINKSDSTKIDLVDSEKVKDTIKENVGSNTDAKAVEAEMLALQQKELAKVEKQKTKEEKLKLAEQEKVNANKETKNAEEEAVDAKEKVKQSKKELADTKKEIEVAKEQEAKTKKVKDVVEAPKQQKKTSDTKKVKEDLKEVEKQLRSVEDGFERIGTLKNYSETTVIGDDGVHQMIRIVETYEDSLGKIQKITKLIDEGTGDLLDKYETKVDKTEEKITKLLDKMNLNNEKGSIRKLDERSFNLGGNEYVDKKDNIYQDVSVNVIKAQKEYQRIIKLQEDGKKVSLEEVQALEKQITLLNTQMHIIENNAKRKKDQSQIEEAQIKQNEKKNQQLIQENKYLDEAYRKILKISSNDDFLGGLDLSSFKEYENLINELSNSNKSVSPEQQTQLKALKFSMDSYIKNQQEALELNKKINAEIRNEISLRDKILDNMSTSKENGSINKLKDRGVDLQRDDYAKNERNYSEVINGAIGVQKEYQRIVKLIEQGKDVSLKEVEALQEQVNYYNLQYHIIERKIDRIKELEKLESKNTKNSEQKNQYLIKENRFLDDNYDKILKISQSKFSDGNIDISKFEELGAILDEISKSGDLISPEQTTIIKKLEDDITRYIKLQEDAIANNKAMIDDSTWRSKASDDIQKKIYGWDKKEIGRIDPKTKEDIKDLQNAYRSLDAQVKNGEISNGEYKESLSKLSVEASRLEVDIKKTSLATNEFSDTMKRLGQYYGIYEIFQAGKRAIEDMIGSVLELDASIVEINKVVDIPNMDNFIEQAYEMGTAIGQSGKAIMDGAGDFARMGKTLEESLDLSQVANEMVLVGDGIQDVSVASGVLQSALALFEDKGYSARNVLDLINQSANQTGATFESLATIVQRSSTLGLSGSSLEEIIALGSALFEVTRDAEASATALNMINQRLMGLNDEGEYSVELVSKLGADLEKLTGVKVMDDQTGELRSTFDILNDISKVWNTIDKNTQIATATLVGNNRHAKSFVAIMENYQTVQKSIEQSQFADGSSQKELQAYMNSLTGAVTQLKAEWEKLAITTIQSDWIEGVVRGTTSMLEFINACGGLIPVLGTVISLLVIWKSQNIANWLVGAKEAMGTLVVSMKNLAFGLKTAEGATASFGVALQGALGWVGLLGVAIGVTVGLLNKMDNARKESIRTSQESSATALEEVKALEEATNKYKEVMSSTMSAKEKKEEISLIQDALNGKYKDEKIALDSSTEAYERQIEKLREASKEKAEFAKLQSQDAMDKIQQDLFSDTVSVTDKNPMMNNFVADEQSLAQIKDMIENVNNQVGESIFSVVADKYFDNEYRIALNPYLDTTLVDESMEKLMLEVSNTWGSDNYIYEALKVNYDKILPSVQAYEEELRKQEEANRIIAQSEATKFANMNKSTVGVTNLSKATTSQIKALEKMYVKEAMSKDATLDLSQAQEDFRSALHGVNKEYDSSNDIITASSYIMETYGTVLQEADNRLKEVASNVGTLDSAIQKMNEGTNLTTEDISSLVQQFPQLSEELIKTENGYTINVEALKDLRTATIDQERQTLQSQINNTKAVKENIRARIEMYGIELEAIKSSADAQREANKVKDSMNDWIYGSDSKNGGYRPASYKGSNYTAEEQEVISIINSIGKLEDKLKALDVIDVGGVATNTAKNATDKKKKETDDAQKKLDEAFKKSLESIKRYREEKQREIDLLQEQINLDSLLGIVDDSKMTKMTTLLNEMKGMSGKEIAKYSELMKTYAKDNEKILELEVLISEAKKQGYVDEQKYIQNSIDLLNQKFEVLERGYDKELQSLERKQILLEKGSEEDLAIEREKLLLKQKMQTEYYNMVKSLKELGLKDDSELVQRYNDLWEQAETERLNMMKQIAEERRRAELEAINNQISDLKEAEGAITNLHDLVIKMLKDEQKAKKEALDEELKQIQENTKEQLDGYKKIIDQKKKALRDEKDQHDYEKGLKEKQKKIKDVEDKLADMQFDNSNATQAEKKRLEEELQKYREELEEYQYDHSIDMREEALDAEYERCKEELEKEEKAKEDSLKEQIKDIEDFLKDEGKLREEALKLIESKNKELYDRLIAWNKQYGDGIDQTITSAWDSCYEAMDKYGVRGDSILDTLQRMRIEMEKLVKEAKDLEELSIKDLVDKEFGDDKEVNKPNTGGGGSDDKYDGLTDKDEKKAYIKKQLQRMIELGDEMNKTKDTNKIKQLREEQRAIAKTIGAWEDSSGTWYIMVDEKKYKIRDAINKYHTGGIVGGDGYSVKPTEEMAKLLKGELVITQPQAKSFMNETLPNLMGGGRPTEVNIESLIRADKIEKDVNIDELMNKAKKAFQKEFKDVFRNNGVKTSLR